MALLNNIMTLPPPKESNFNYSAKHRTDLFIGMATPVDNIQMIPGDVINLSDRAKMLTDALQLPLFGSMRLQIDQFFVPYRILWNKWPDFIMQGEEMDIEIPYYVVRCIEADVMLQQTEFVELSSMLLPYSKDGVSETPVYDFDLVGFYSRYRQELNRWEQPFINGWREQDFSYFRWQSESINDALVNDSTPEFYGYATTNRSPLNIVKPCSLVNYLELPVGHVDTYDMEIVSFESRHPLFNVLAYNKIWYEWYRNPQERDYTFYGQPSSIRLGDNSLSISTTSPFSITYTNEEMDEAINWVNSTTFDNEGFTYHTYYGSDSFGYKARKFLFSLKKRCYKHDYLSSVLNAENYENATATVTVSGNQFTINQWRQALHVDKYQKRKYLGGDKYIDWIRAQYGVIDSDARLQRPQLLSSTSSEIIFVDVESTASTDGATLGQLAARGLTLNQQQDDIKFRATEHGVLMTIASIVPIVDNVYGVSKFSQKCDVFDHFVPALDNIDMQPVHAYEYSTVDGVHMDLASDKYLSISTQFIKDGFGDSVTVAANAWDAYFTQRQMYIQQDMQHRAFGYLPAWTEYKTRMNRVSGYLSTNRVNMVLSRPNPYANDITTFNAVTGKIEPIWVYEPHMVWSLEDKLTSINSDYFYYPEFTDNWINNVYVSQYVDFRDYAYLWPDTTGKYPTCEVQFAFDVVMRRPMSKWSLPL